MSENLSCVIQAGHLGYSEGPVFLCAVCGNGVVVTLRDRVSCIGGMAHVVYPKLERGTRPTNFYVDTALSSLIKILFDLGSASGRNFEAQILGGGHRHGMGKKRAEDCVQVVRKLLKKEKIEIVSEDIGGVLGRKIIFNTSNGETIAMKTSRIRQMDWLPEWEYQIGVKRIAYARGE
jgi:chemotaxis protein CheD